MDTLLVIPDSSAIITLTLTSVTTGMPCIGRDYVMIAKDPANRSAQPLAVSN